MILAAHALTGATVASLIPNHPVLGFVAGFGSHFVIDTIPHWGYELSSLERGDKLGTNSIGKLTSGAFSLDVLRVVIDCFVGVLLVYFVFHSLPISRFTVALGAFGALIPDGLQFLYVKWKWAFLRPLQIFHEWLQTCAHPKDGIIGILTHVLLALVLIQFVLKWHF